MKTMENVGIKQRIANGVGKFIARIPPMAFYNDDSKAFGLRRPSFPTQMKLRKLKPVNENELIMLEIGRRVSQV